VKNIIQIINPLAEFGPSLFEIKKPARYLGGEVGSHAPATIGDSRLTIALCFPDLYEIGMSNNAIRILYNDIGGLNSEIACERVFAPAPDYEALLKSRSIPLHSLESGIPLCDFNIIGFSIGYELLATNILSILESGKVPLIAKERGENDPIVIAGGPAATNPKPLAPFLDAVYIGEAEAEFYGILKTAAQLKREGKGRLDILKLLSQSKAFWMPRRDGLEEKHAWKAVFTDFPSKAASTVYPISVLQTVQSHGTVEIMRGCPNGCRFCHAGYLYRPQRVKTRPTIEKEVQNLVSRGGYKEITLASLSSGDYPDIAGLLRELNGRWKEKFVSFQLPSLKVDSFTLPLLAELSEIRKSGLTFAVETPNEDWQKRINKTVDFEKIVGILGEARKYGFRSAKFYFMIGLPVPGKGRGEGEAIIDFLEKIALRDKMPLNVNIGTFIPKPHTPYERESQIDEKTALETIYLIKDALRRHRQISISYQSPFTSILEGIISRGDERTASFILSAYRNGARFDAWDDYFNKEAWDTAIQETIEKEGYDPRIEFLGAKSLGQALPWDGVHLFVGKGFFQHEAACSEDSELTGQCEEDCDHPCGSCNDSFTLFLDSLEESAAGDEKPTEESTEYRDIGFSTSEISRADTLEDQRFIVSYSRIGPAVFYPLHSFAAIFGRAFDILKFPVRYSEGFNPAPKIELNQPLALGIDSLEEILAVWLSKDISIYNMSLLISAINSLLPAGILINGIRLGKRRKDGKNTIGSLYLGSRYRIALTDKNHAATLFSFFSESPHCSNIEIGHDEESESSVVAADIFDAHGKDSSLISMVRSALCADNYYELCTISRISILAGNVTEKAASTRLYDIL
jgi:radical SAM family uncharacterized protein